jgi:hypothetical protein
VGQPSCLYLLPLAPFSLLYVPSRLVVPGDAATTASNILASETLFRLGIVSGLLSQISFVFVGLLLYQLLKPVNKTMALLMVILNLIGIPISMANEANQLAILFVLHGAGSPALFTPDQVHALVLMFLNLHDNGINIALFTSWGELFLAMWLLITGIDVERWEKRALAFA